MLASHRPYGICRPYLGRLRVPRFPLSTAVLGGYSRAVASLSPVLGSCLPHSWGQGCSRILHPVSLHHIADVWFFLGGGRHTTCVPLRSNPWHQLPGLGPGFRVVGYFFWAWPGLLVAAGAHSSYFSLLVSFSQD